MQRVKAVLEGKQPDRLANLGYDAARLAAMAISQGGYTRDSFVSKLMNIRYFEGSSGLISFGEMRENIQMPLYRIENEQAVAITRSGSTAESETSDSED